MSEPVVDDRRSMRRRAVLAGILLGMGTVAFVDEVVFHQLLQWHHFYDLGSSRAALVSDGLFHAFSWFATVAGLLMVVALARRDALRRWALFGGWLTGVGFFQLYDGLVQHKVLGLHQIRYGVDLLVYDVTWNVIAAVLLVAGLVVSSVTGRRARGGADRTGTST